MFTHLLGEKIEFSTGFFRGEEAGRWLGRGQGEGMGRGQEVGGRGAGETWGNVKTIYILPQCVCVRTRQEGCHHWRRWRTGEGRSGKGGREGWSRMGERRGREGEIGA
jgi:hypothetical protein